VVSYVQVKGYGLKQGFMGIVKPSKDTPDYFTTFTGEVGSYPAKAISETATHYYTYTRSGRIESATPKTSLQQYLDFVKREIKFKTTTTRSGIIEEKRRITPLTAYEKSIGISLGDFSMYGIIDRKPTLLGLHSIPDFVKQKQLETSQRLQREQAERELAEELRLREESQQRPNPKEESIGSVEIFEPTPVTYFPLVIVGVAVIGVILFLRRRA
jgi:hypothetical protein